jgi:hypothetical protein
MSAPDSVPPELAAQIRRLLGEAGSATVPSAILNWWGTSDLPDGTDGAPCLDARMFTGAYLRLENSALSRGVVRPLLEVLGGLSGYRPDGPLPIAIARFRYAAPRADLVQQVLAAAAEGRGLSDPPARLADALDERQAFLAAGLLHDQWGFAQPAYRGRRVPWLVTEDLLLAQPGTPAPDGVEIDPGDGGGFRAAELGVPVEASYPDDAVAAQAAVRCRYGSETLTARFTVPFSDQPAAPVPDETWRLTGDCGNTGTAYVYLAAGSRLRRPVIMVEGFPGGHAPDYLYDTLDQQGTATSLRAAGYDLVIVGLDRGMDRIQRNADVLVACIREAIQRTDAPLVVGGVSMGGLISRYGLAAMETRGEPHNTEVFLTIDTPHGGTYTSLGTQWFVHSFLPYLPALAGYAEQLDSPANQQFDLWWLHDGVAGVSPLRDEFLRDLAAVGNYPRHPRRLAISSGRGDGAREAPPAAQTLRWDGGPWVSAQTWTVSSGRGTIGSGHWFGAEPPALLPLEFDPGVTWDGAPGGQEPYNGQVAALAAGVGCGTVTHAFDFVCTVPTISALDLHQHPFAPVPPGGTGAGPFDDYACALTNQPHLTITPEVSKWLLTALGSPIVTEAVMADD